MRREKILLSAIYVMGVVSLAIFIITKSETLMDAATTGMFKDGDLYRFAKVLPFKMELPAEECADDDEPDIDPDTCAVVIIGDSFIETCRGHQRFSDMLSRKLNSVVYPVYAGLAPEYFDPVYFCWKNGFDPDQKRTIILERVERYVINSFMQKRLEDTALVRQMERVQQPAFWRVMKRRLFTDAEKNYDVFLTSSDLTAPLVELWSTFRFIFLKKISDETPIYSLDPPFLFDKEEVSSNMPTSFYYHHPDSLVGSIADNIAATSRVLQARYNAELVFMPIPNAYTLYHSFVNNDPYDGFLPRLCARLEQKGVRTIQLYEKFRESKEILYFPTDTHWNATGAKIAVDEAHRRLIEHH